MRSRVHMVHPDQELYELGVQFRVMVRSDRGTLSEDEEGLGGCSLLLFVLLAHPSFLSLKFRVAPRRIFCKIRLCPSALWRSLTLLVLTQ